MSRLLKMILAASLASSSAFAAETAAPARPLSGLDNSPHGPGKTKPATQPAFPRSLGALMNKPNHPTVEVRPKGPGFVGRIREAIATSRQAKVADAAALEASYGDPAKPELGKVVRGAVGPNGSRVLFGGDLSEGRKLPRVFAVAGDKSLVHGTRNPDGSILWDANSRGPAVPDAGGPRSAPKYPPPSTQVYNEATKQIETSVRKNLPPSTVTGSGYAEQSRRYQERVRSNPQFDPATALKNESAQPSAAAKAATPETQKALAAAARRQSYREQLKAIESGQPVPETPKTPAASNSPQLPAPATGGLASPPAAPEPLVKPSEWRSKLGLSAAQARDLGVNAAKQANRARKGIWDIAMARDKAGNAGASTGNSGANTALNMNSLPAASLAFAASLGAAAAINSALFSGTNPLAKDQAHDMIHDEVMWLGIAGQVVTTNYLMFRTPVNGLLNSPTAPLWKKSGAFGLVLAIGSMAQMGIWEFANDADIRACVGFTNYHKTGNPFGDARDWEACDRAFAKEHLRDLAQHIIVDRFIPMAATVAVSGSLLFATLYGTGKALQMTKVFTGLGKFAAGTGGGLPMAGLRIALMFAPTVGVQVLYQSLIGKPAELTMSEWAKFQQSQFTFQKGVYAATSDNAERDLYDSWNRIKKANWADPSDMSRVQNAGYDATRIGPKFYDPKVGNIADFEGALATYDAHQAAWREQALAKTRSLYKDWKEKVSRYHELYSYAQGFYKDAVEKIVFTLQNPNTPASDPRVFNLENMKAGTHTRRFSDTTRALFYWATFIESSDGPFRYVATPDLNQLLIAYMACGPQIEGKSQPGWFASGVNYIRKNAPFIADAPPDEMIVNEAGRHVVFSPPRIVDSPNGVNVCDIERTTLSKWSRSDVNNFEIRVGGKKWVGLTSYILDNVSATVVGNSGDGPVNRLADWWNDFVMQKDAKVNDELAVEYQAVVDKFFKPALVNDHYYACENNAATKGSRLEDYLYRLGDQGAVCGTSRTHRMADGVINNLRDQSRMYVALMMDLYSSNLRVLGAPRLQNASYGEVLNSVLKPARDLLEAYDKFAVQYSKFDDPEAQKAAVSELTAKFRVFKAVVNPDAPSPVQQASFNGAAAPFQKEWMKLLEVNLNSSLATLMAYVQLAALPRVGGME